MLALDDNEIILLLKSAIEQEGSISAFARCHRLERSHLNNMLNKNRPLSARLVRALGLRRVYAPDL